MQTAPKVGRSGEAEEESWLNFDPFMTSFLRVMGNRKSRRARLGGPKSSQNPFSFIRTVTVGPGIAPDLLTRPNALERRSRACRTETGPAYRRWGIAPRPENVAARDNRRQRG
jgi:hypothetical protein